MFLLGMMVYICEQFFFAELGGVLTFILLALWGDELFGAWTLVVTEVSLGMGMFFLATVKLREKRGL
ncbi:hypothetical protein Z046_10275 [Pseudomonas aeruginosa VRFPA09]|nr:hypothetical protein P797_22105 [Pseudomonas aeruginosa VRFPA04]EQL39782.1 hypothetical protein M770_20420 [Pseudomonas aeruginosa VRFPA03]EVT88624.1 hypothetical protein Z046_10275 [Pseudomonas aeruginosa VRFPA09]